MGRTQRAVARQTYNNARGRTERRVARAGLGDTSRRPVGVSRGRTSST